MNAKIQYPYIVAWGRMMGSFQYYIDDQVAAAIQDGAPPTATHRRQDGTWSTFEDILREDTRAWIAAEVSKLTEG